MTSKSTHSPVDHILEGAVGYRLEWNGTLDGLHR